MTGMLAEVLEKIEALDPETLKTVTKEVMEATKDMAWIPSPGPQTDAYFSKADIMLYGGEPGGGKSSLILGLAMTAHQNSIIMRRQYTDLGHLVDESIKFNGTRNGFNGSPPPKLKTRDGRHLEFFAAAKVGDEQHRQGNPFDFMGVDEATQFAKSQLTFVMIWLRSVIPGQRKRVVFATNPPLTAEGLWITEMFAPWLDETFHDPAKPGELRWGYLDENEDIVWVDGSDPVWNEHLEKMVDPSSYTYIPASLGDNPFLADTGYEKQLDSAPESIRSILMGGFKTSFKDAPNQMIPTEWVLLAQQRWFDTPPEGVPMCSMGVDATGGGEDPLVIASRYDGWYAPLIKVPAKDVPKTAISKTTVGHIITNRRDAALIIIDLGGGYGSGSYELLIENEIEVQGYQGAAKTPRRSVDKKYTFTNTRSAAYWLFMEALDPGQPGGSPIQLPADNRMLAGLTAVTFEVTPNGIKAEPKVKYDEKGKATGGVKAKLGFSPDEADAVVMAWYYGAKESNSALEWIDQKRSFNKRGQSPRVISGRQR